MDLFYALSGFGETDRSAQVESLCKIHADLVTLQLWGWLRNRAAFLAGGSSARQSVLAYRTALQVAQVLNDHRTIAVSYFALGRKLTELGLLDEAVEALLSGCTNFSRAGLPRDALTVNSHLSQVYLLGKNFVAARNLAEKSLQLEESLRNSDAPPGISPDEFGIALAVFVLAHLDLREGLYPDSIDKLHRALDLFERMDRSLPIYGTWITETLDSLGDAYSQIGNYQWALVHLERALSRARAQSSRVQECAVLQRLGSLYLKREDYDRAEAYFVSGMQIADEENDKRQISNSLLAMGIVALRQMQVERAVPNLRRSLQMALDLGDLDTVILARQHLSAVASLEGNNATALAEVNLGEEAAKSANDPLRIGEVAAWKAEILRRLGRSEEALIEAGKALSLAKQHNFSTLLQITSVTLAQLYLARNETAAAKAVLKPAVDQLDELRGSILGDIHQQQLFFGKRVGALHLLTEILVKENRALEALEYAEHAKARVLLDMINAQRINPALVLTPKERAEDQRMTAELTALTRQMREEAARSRPNELSL
ncbi:MAG: tetratricopeptide repeat protein, partial [Acidobacteriota bacterium]